MFKLFLGAALASLTASAMATENSSEPTWALGLHLYTHHIDAPRQLPLRDSNPGVYVHVTRGTFRGMTAGAFRNSFDATSVYLAWTLRSSDDMFALSLGAVSGYRYPPRGTVDDPAGFGSVTYVENDEWMPLLVPSVRLSTSRVCVSCAVRLSYLPKRSAANSAAGVHLSVERGF